MEKLKETWQLQEGGRLQKVSFSSKLVFSANYIIRESSQFFTYFALGSFLINHALSGHLLGDIDTSVNVSQKLRQDKTS